MRIFLCIITLSLIVSCGKEQTAKVVEMPVETRDSIPLSKPQIAKLRVEDYVLSNKAQEITENWEAYQKVYAAVESIKKGKFTFLTDNEEVLYATLNELNSTLPEGIKTTAVESRILVLKTKLLFLKETLDTTEFLVSSDADSIKAVLQSLANLKLQINKKLERDAQKINKPT